MSDFNFYGGVGFMKQRWDIMMKNWDLRRRFGIYEEDFDANEKRWNLIWNKHSLHLLSFVGLFVIGVDRL